MKIVLISARHSSTIACEHYIYKALINMGHEVVADLCFRSQYNTINDNIPSDADLLIAWKGSSLDPQVIKRLKYPTALWYPDFWIMKHTQVDIMSIAHAFDFVYTPIKDDATFYRSLGLNGKYLAPGVDINTFKRLPNIDKECDIFMCGALYPERRNALEKLKAAGLDVVSGQDMDHKETNVAHNKAKIIFNQGVIPNKGAQLRVYEAMASGTMLLQHENEELAEVFEDNKHLVYFNNSNLVEKAIYYIREFDKCEEIAHNGMKEVQNNHTWEKRLQLITAVAMIWCKR